MGADADAGHQLALNAVEERGRRVEHHVGGPVGQRGDVIGDGDAERISAQDLAEIAPDALGVEVEGADEDVAVVEGETGAGLADGAETKLDDAERHEQGKGGRRKARAPSPGRAQKNPPPRDRVSERRGRAPLPWQGGRPNSVAGTATWIS